MLKLRAEAREEADWERTATIRRDLYDRWKKEGAPDASQIDPLIHNPMATRAQREAWARTNKPKRRKTES